MTEDLVRRLCSSAVEGALSLLSNADTIMKNFLAGPSAADLKVLLAMLRYLYINWFRMTVAYNNIILYIDEIMIYAYLIFLLVNFVLQM